MRNGKSNPPVTIDSLLISYNQSVVRPLNCRRQSRGIALVLHVMRDMSQVSSSWLQLFNVLERFVHPEMSWMFLKSQAVKHKDVETAQLIHCVRRNLAEVSCICEVIQSVSHHRKPSVNNLQRRNLQILSQAKRSFRNNRVRNHLWQAAAKVRRLE